jgi:hypothetical protein
VKLEKELKELKDENAVLRQNRASLVDKSTADGSLSESRAKTLQEDNVRHSNWRKVKADSRLA